MTRYLPARHYITFGITALALGMFSAGWESPTAALSFIPAGSFVATAIALLVLALRPAIDVQDAYLSIGKNCIPWMDIRRIDRTKWHSPLIVRMTLYDDSRITLIYPG